MNDFLSFRKMITPLFIQVIFWLFVILVVISGIITMTQGGAMILAGLLAIIVGPLIARIYCELLIILFRIYDELVAIRTGQPPSGQGFPVMPPAGVPGAYVPPPAGQYVPPPPAPPRM
ncbi:MAG TPA: DUF4282 domain-containing protein [Tepidisphaeraceae bacterium]|jgi:hypothetical protein